MKGPWRSLRRAPVVAALLLALAASGAAAAATRVVPESREEIRLSFAPLVKRAAPAVVNIYAKRVVRSEPISPFFNDPFFRRFFGENSPFGRSRERVQNALGSGVIVRPDGLIVTNRHVIAKASSITVVLADRREFDARLLGTDERTDLALLRIDPGNERLPYLQMRDSDDLEVGDLVLAIGNPFGVGQTVTSGIVSALARTAVGVSDYSFFIQTDAAINPGNSGGALITMDGRLAGINTAIYSRSGGSVGIGFAIPSNMVATVVDALDHGGKVVRPWLGAETQDVTAEIADGVGLERPIGVIVRKIYPGGPADRAGLRVGDVITAVNDREVADHAGLSFRIGTLRLGAEATLEVWRAGRTHRLRLLVAAAPKGARHETVMRGENPFAGAVVADLSPALAEELKLDSFDRGVVILKLRPGSTADRLGFERGDVIVSVHGRRVRSVAELRRVLDQPGREWQISLRRGDRTLSFVVGG